MRRITGGCQCGAVRYALISSPRSPYLPLPHVPEGGRWPFRTPRPVLKPAVQGDTRHISYFLSSDAVARGFCCACGTPLIFHYPGGDEIGVSLGTPR